MSYIAYGIFSDLNNISKRVGARLNNIVIDVTKLAKLSILDPNLDKIFNSQTLNPFMKYPQNLRKQIKPVLAKVSIASYFYWHMHYYFINTVHNLLILIRVGPS